jgi:hypothetical protein
VILNVAAGICLLAFWYGYAFLLPFKMLKDGVWHLAAHSRWTPINLFGVAGTVLASAGLIVFSWTTNLDTPGLIGVLLAVAGLQLLGANLVWESLIWPVLAKQTPDLLRFDGPLYTSRVLLGFFTIAGVAFASGYVTLAVSIGGVAPVWVAVGLGVGAPLFALGPLFGRFQIAVRSIGITLLAISQAALALL